MDIRALLGGLAGVGMLMSGSAGAAQLPDTSMEMVPGRTALVVTDPQNDFLHPEGVAWGVVKDSVKANGTIENLEQLFKAAKAADMPVFVSPHYYYPHDHQWEQGGGPIEVMMHNAGMFDREGVNTVKGFEDSGADWLERYEPYIEDGATVITNPHKIYGPQNNDLVLQLRKNGIERVVLAGMSANLCTESHMRALLESGFQVAVVTDATAAAQVDEGDGYAAALTNFRFMANDTLATDEAVKAIRNAGQGW